MSDPDLLQRDTENRRRALELRSFIVEAPAGAGKTELLTQRYLKLLGIVGAPEEIVAITFTNKAAAEMRSRVLQALQDAKDQVPVTRAHRRQTRALAEAALLRSDSEGWALLDQPGRLRINTIDSLSSLLARQMPLMSRFGAQPAVSEQADAQYAEAARLTLAMLEDEPGDGPVTAALAYFDNDAVQLGKLLAEMLARRDQWLEHSGRRPARQEAEAAWTALVTHDLQPAAQLLAPALQQQLMPLARFAAANLACDHPLSLLLDWETPLRPVVAALAQWRALCELLMTAKDEWRKRLNVNQGFPANEAGRQAKQALLEVIAELPGPLAPALARVRRLPDPGRLQREWQIIEHLVHLLHRGCAHLIHVFQQAGDVDFVEVSHRALQALEDESGPTDLALRLDYSIHHLLVDEFQDTSPAQVELLRRLTRGWEPGDGRTLFCVGDPMQSIYRFRKAEVGLFLQAERYGIGHLPLECLHLTRNNRSCPSVVAWVNATFGQVFPPEDSETRGAIQYRPFVATREAQPGEGVHLHALVAEAGVDGDTLAAMEAVQVADLIARERAAYPDNRIAVLVKARSHLQALVEEIRLHRPQLRFQAVEVEVLAGRQAVQDMLSLIHALYHRADRVHWLAVLRAPWCGLTLADLHALAADRPQATVWSLLQDADRLQRLSEDGRQRLLHLREVFAEAFAHQGRQPVRRWVESVWLQLNGPACLWDAGDVRDVQALLDLIERQEARGRFSPERLQLELEELYAAPDIRADGKLQFMTLHKSKGLEFDCVILPGLHRQPPREDAPLVLWEAVPIAGAPAQLVAAPLVPAYLRDGQPSAYEYLRGLEQERKANEAARVLYVGVTRTEHRLHLVGALSLNADGACKPPAGSFLESLWPAVGTDFEVSARSPLPAPSQTGADGFVPSLIRLPQPGLPGLLQDMAHPPRTEQREERVAAGADSLEAACGSLAHLYLELLATQDLSAWTAARIAGLRPAMQRWLQQQGQDAASAADGASRVAGALQATLESEAGRWVLQPRASAACELALVAYDGSRTATHVVDRTFVEDGCRWVIDYKSARLDEGASAQAATALADRFRPQLERYARLFEDAGLPVRKAVFFIGSGRLVELD